MRERCSNPNHENWAKYGGRGIRVCERWSAFANFLADMGQPGEAETIERVNNDGDYEPANCRWASRKEQARNRRSSAMLTWRGETLCIAGWAERLGVPANRIQERIANGWSIDDALTRPAKQQTIRPPVEAR